LHKYLSLLVTNKVTATRLTSTYHFGAFLQIVLQVYMCHVSSTTQTQISNTCNFLFCI